MKLKDIFCFLFVIVFFTFFMIDDTRGAYETAYHFSPELVSFIKFAILATFGEMAGARIKTGRYLPSGFGLIPRAMVWGLLGTAISISFRIFSGGVGSFGVFKEVTGIPMAVLRAFVISLMMNIFFAPIMMLAHKITDQHISDEEGGFSFRRINIADILKRLDWENFWNFLMKKTIPLFWIPAHTVTFLLPTEFRTLFAALLSIFLGLFLSISGSQKKGLSKKGNIIVERSA